MNHNASGHAARAVARGLLVAAGLCAISAACRPAPHPPQPPVLATIFDEPITVDDFRARLEANRLARPSETVGPAAGEAQDDLTLNLLNQMIDEKLFLLEARRVRLSVSESELTGTIERIRNDYTDEAFDDYLKSQNIAYAHWTEAIRNDLVIRKLVQLSVDSRVSVTPEAVEAYYAEHASEFEQKEQVRARQIVVATEDEAKRLRDQLVAARPASSFEELASNHSLSPDRAQGGDLGFFARAELPEEFDVVFDLAPGQISRVVKSAYGYHIFKLIEKRPKKRLTLVEAGEAIRTRLLQQQRERRFAEWLAGLRQKAQVKINLELLHQLPLTAGPAT